MKITRRQLRYLINESLDASYEAARYIPALERAISPLRGVAAELKSATWGEYTDVIHKEIEDAMSSLNLVAATLREVQAEHKTGPFGGKLKRRERFDVGDRVVARRHLSRHSIAAGDIGIIRSEHSDGGGDMFEIEILPSGNRITVDVASMSLGWRKA